MRISRSCLAAIILALPGVAQAQSGFVGPDGSSRYPGVTILRYYVACATIERFPPYSTAGYTITHSPPCLSTPISGAG
jgi:hypothetical protein